MKLESKGVTRERVRQIIKRIEMHGPDGLEIKRMFMQRREN